MREHRFLYDFPDVADCEGSCVGGGGPPCLLHAGLCCPDDPLETIMDNPDVFSDDLLEDLFIAAALPPPHRGWLPITIGGGGERVVDVDGADVGYRDRGGASSDDGAPRLPAAHAAMSADDSSWTTSSVATKSPPSLETESSPPSVSRLVVPRKKRDSSVKRGKRLWSLDIPNVPASSDNSSGRDDGDQDGRRNIIHGGGGGVRQRLLIARPPRNSRTQRACSHCASTETPQWRAGPDGPGTLCNACGIRYKMNKLLPEYRPSTSPSFRSDKHSNRHRKVVKLREKVKVEKIVNMPLAPADCGGDFMDTHGCLIVIL
uniref:GATA-type domain-containing protein n=1 Tax=Setaria italica TaxID=4555 RepID=K3YZ64_SETIT